MKFWPKKMNFGQQLNFGLKKSKFSPKSTRGQNSKFWSKKIETLATTSTFWSKKINFCSPKMELFVLQKWNFLFSKNGIFCSPKMEFFVLQKWKLLSSIEIVAKKYRNFAQKKCAKKLQKKQPTTWGLKHGSPDAGGYIEYGSLGV